MKQNCLNCINLSSHGMGEVHCKKKGRMSIQDPSEYVRSNNDCEFFDPKIVYQKNSKKEMYLSIVESLKGSLIIGDSVRSFVQVPTDSHMSTERGMAMIMLSDDGLPSFEADSEFKSYNVSNHIFADLLEPISSKIRNPIIFWLAHRNPPGAKYLLETEPLLHHVIQLGKPYSLPEVLFCLARALKHEGICLVEPWFVRDIERIAGKKIEQMEPICQEVYLEIEPSTSKLLVKAADRLQNGTTNWFLYEGRPPDLEVASKVMSLGNCYICRTDARKTVLCWKVGGEKVEECDFSEFIAQNISPLDFWILLSIEDTYWGGNWIPVLEHISNLQAGSGGLAVFIKADLIDEAPFKSLVDYNRTPVIDLR